MFLQGVWRLQRPRVNRERDGDHLSITHDCAQRLLLCDERLVDASHLPCAVLLYPDANVPEASLGAVGDVRFEQRVAIDANLEIRLRSRRTCELVALDSGH